MSSTHGNGIQKVQTSGTHSVASRISQGPNVGGAGHIRYDQYSPRSSVNGGHNATFARQYVGELMQRVNFE